MPVITTVWAFSNHKNFNYEHKRLKINIALTGFYFYCYYPFSY